MNNFWCDNCNSLKLSEYHRCLSRWLVREAGGDTDWSDIVRKYYARDAKAAAEAFAASDWNHEGEGHHIDVEVMPYPSIDRIYEVSVSIELVYSYSAAVNSERPYCEEEVEEEEV